MSMLPRLKPRCFYDLVIEVAIVRPGPIQGDMVHPYLRRRDGQRAGRLPLRGAARPCSARRWACRCSRSRRCRSPSSAAGFTPDEADGLRRAMATFRHIGTIHTFREKFIDGMVGNGYEREFAERCFSQIEGFGEYGFPESHAASFACWSTSRPGSSGTTRRCSAPPSSTASRWASTAGAAGARRPRARRRGAPPRHEPAATGTARWSRPPSPA